MRICIPSQKYSSAIVIDVIRRTPAPEYRTSKLAASSARPSRYPEPKSWPVRTRHMGLAEYVTCPYIA
ncbi:hypothetical protein AVEN_165351-1 [Araneus ventricosus]|uniref:Uncharacterized protein n=1 Tax=Araneus ventricosus TaxID=182803 RepID=A0A4Y2AUE2_ARAVE|nr:hypothetical protein AVEN_165351-1 [Araneus ventricosus]